MTNDITIIACPPRCGSSALINVLKKSNELLILNETGIWIESSDVISPRFEFAIKHVATWASGLTRDDIINYAKNKKIIDKWPIFYLTNWPKVVSLSENKKINIIYLVRNPRDQAASLLRGNYGEGWGDKSPWVTNDKNHAVNYRNIYSWMFSCLMWENIKQQIIIKQQNVKTFEIRYEDLISDIAVIKNVFLFLDTEFTSEIENYFKKNYVTKNVGNHLEFLDEYFSDPNYKFQKLLEYWRYTGSQ